jgi:hypothetical protein
MNRRKKVFTSILIVVLVAASAIFFVDEYLNYAIVEYYLSGPSYVNSGVVLQVNLYVYDAGNVNAEPALKVTVVNATIQRVSVPSVVAGNLSSFCWFNGTTALIENITASAKANYALWGVVYVVPGSNVSSFTIFANATIPFDILHIRNVVTPRAPSEIYYSLTSSTFFMRPMP